MWCRPLTIALTVTCAMGGLVESPITVMSSTDDVTAQTACAECFCGNYMNANTHNMMAAYCVALCFIVEQNCPAAAAGNVIRTFSREQFSVPDGAALDGPITIDNLSAEQTMHSLCLGMMDAQAQTPNACTGNLESILEAKRSAAPTTAPTKFPTSNPTPSPTMQPSTLFSETPWFSEENSGNSQARSYPIRWLRCGSSYCDNIKLSQGYTGGCSLDAATAYWTDWFSEEGGGSATCAANSVVKQVQCRGRYCDDLRLLCAPFQGRKCHVQAGTAQYTGEVSEENGWAKCRSGYVATGMTCRGRYCDAMKLRCEKMNRWAL